MIERIALGDGSADVRRLLETSPSGAVITSKAGLTLFRNARFNELMRLPAQVSDPIDVRRFFLDPGDKLRVRRLLSDDVQHRLEFRFRAFDGSDVWAIVTMELLDYAGQNGVLSWLFDITERKRAEDVARQEQAQLDLAISATNSSVWEVDLVTGERWWSPQLFGMLGYLDEAEAQARMNLWEDRLHPGDRTRVLEALHACIEGAKGNYDDTYRMIRRDGGEIWIEAKGRTSYDADGKPLKFNGFMTEITERKRNESDLLRAKDDAERALSQLRHTQEELIQSEKMAALGSLVAGVAHEINTPLGNALTASSHLADQVDSLASLFTESKMRRSDLEQFLGLVGETTTLMLANLERAVELVQSFKQVAVDQTSGERRQFDLKGYIDEVLLSLRPRLRKTRHQVAVDCPKDILVDGYPGALSQILTNFVLNSLLHAYPGDAAGHLAITVLQPNPDWIELTYADDGVGIPAELVGRIYDPFFTTKRGSGGSGLGLHIVYNLVAVSLGGHISVKSETGHGTKFLLRFPRAAPVDNISRAPEQTSTAEQELRSHAIAEVME